MRVSTSSFVKVSHNTAVYCGPEVELSPCQVSGPSGRRKAYFYCTMSSATLHMGVQSTKVDSIALFVRSMGPFGGLEPGPGTTLL